MQDLSRPLPLCFIAAEWHGHITVVVVIHEDRTGLQAATHAVRARQIAGLDRGAQTVVAVVTSARASGFIAKTGDDQYRSENLIAADVGLRRGVDKKYRADGPPGVRGCGHPAQRARLHRE